MGIAVRDFFHSTDRVNNTDARSIDSERSSQILYRVCIVDNTIRAAGCDPGVELLLDGWWSQHLQRERYTNPNDYKRLSMREHPPF